MRYPNHVIEDVCRQVDFVAYVRGFVDLKPGGRTWRGLCPFHSEKTPSFHVDPVKNLYYCFGCGKGGGPITFMMEITGQPFLECLREMAERANYTLPTLDHGQRETKGPNRAGLYEVMKTAQEFYVSCLAGRDGREAVDYLRERGVSRDSVTAFGLGLAPKEWDRLTRFLDGKRFSKDIQLEAGLIKKAKTGDRHFDTFRNRITFPIHDGFPRVLAFAARTYAPGDEGAKYINSPTTPIYEKGRQLYGFNLARPYVKSGGVAFLVEGYLDVISMFAGGVKATVAAMGTALTQHQVNSLKGTAKEVQLVFDADNAGMEAAKRALPLLYNADLDGRVIRLPAGHDPDSFIREYGSQAFYDLADKALDLSEFFLGRLLETNAKTVTGQGRIISEMQDILRQVPDAVRGQFLRNKLAERLGLSPELLRLKTVERSRMAAVAPKALPGADYSLLAGKLLKLIITHRECLRLVGDDLLAIWPRDRTARVLTELLAQVKENPDSPDIRPESLRLEDDPLMSSLVTEAMIRPREYPAAKSLETAKLMIAKLSSLAAQKVNEEYTMAIKRAEAMGDTETVTKLMAAKQR
ncbi:MAG: DNA primase [Deltaproteobacteria bacterium]|nr:DNA primase [Deltaproteobacteria bacterium]